MVWASDSDKTPQAISALAYAWEPRISCAHMRLSYERDSLKACMMGSVVPVKRPPHNFFFVKSSLDMVEEKNRVRDGGVCGGYEATLLLGALDIGFVVVVLVTLVLLLLRADMRAKLCVSK